MRMAVGAVRRCTRARACARSSGVVTLMLPRSPSTRCTGKPARSTSIASSVTVDVGRGRHRLREHVATERLRRLREEDRRRAAALRECVRDRRSGVRLLHRVADRQRRDRRAVLARRLDRALDQIGADKRPRRVVNHDEVGCRRHARERVGHRVLTPRAAVDDTSPARSARLETPSRHRAGGHRDDDLVDRGHASSAVDARARASCVPSPRSRNCFGWSAPSRSPVPRGRR